MVAPPLASSKAASIVPERVSAASPVSGSADCPEVALQCGAEQSAGSVRDDKNGAPFANQLKIRRAAPPSVTNDAGCVWAAPMMTAITHMRANGRCNMEQGRFGLRLPSTDLSRRADVSIVVLEPDPQAIAHTRRLADAVRQSLLVDRTLLLDLGQACAQLRHDRAQRRLRVCVARPISQSCRTAEGIVCLPFGAS